VLYYLSHISALFCCSYFSNKVLGICLRWPGPHLIIYTSCIARITGTCYHTQLCWLKWGLIHFLPGLASNPKPPHLCLLRCMIIGMSQCAQHGHDITSVALRSIYLHVSHPLLKSKSHVFKRCKWYFIFYGLWWGLMHKFLYSLECNMAMQLICISITFERIENVWQTYH
jgi:hypothetical protein